MNPDVVEIGGRLDRDHAPETNGRMPVCRRCGAHTDRTAKHHEPAAQELPRSIGWLEAERGRAHILRLRAQSTLTR